jgi:hypothetical protein
VQALQPKNATVGELLAPRIEEKVALLQVLQDWRLVDTSTEGEAGRRGRCRASGTALWPPAPHRPHLQLPARAAAGLDSTTSPPFP